MGTDNPALSNRNEKIIKQMCDKLDAAEGAIKIAAIITDYRTRAKEVAKRCEHKVEEAVSHYEEAEDLVKGLAATVHSRLEKGREEAYGKDKAKAEYLRPKTDPYKE